MADEKKKVWHDLRDLVDVDKRTGKRVIKPIEWARIKIGTKFQDIPIYGRIGEHDRGEAPSVATATAIGERDYQEDRADSMRSDLIPGVSGSMVCSTQPRRGRSVRVAAGEYGENAGGILPYG